VQGADNEPLKLLARGDLAGFVRQLGGLVVLPGLPEAQAGLSAALMAMSRAGDVAAARRLSEQAAAALLELGGTALTPPKLELLLPLLDLVIGMGTREWPTAAELAGRVRRRLSGGPDVPGLLAALLVGPPHRWALPGRVPEGGPLSRVWPRLVCAQPKLCTDEADAEMLDEQVRRLYAEASKDPAHPDSLALAGSLLTLPLYFRDVPVRETMEQRAALLRELCRGQVEENWEPSAIRSPGRLRIGIVAWDFAARTETYTTIPVFSHLPESEFDVRLFAVAPQRTVLPAGFPAIRALPGELAGAARVLRSEDLDVLVFGANVTVATNLLSCLAACRLARRSITFFSSPLTTGLPAVSDYVSGELSECEGAEADYTETLRVLPGAGYCSGHRLLKLPTVATPPRARLGLGEGSVVFSSGAVVHKLSPALRRAWSKILSAVPGSQLLLLPFAPTWDSQWPVLLLRDLFSADFAEFGVDPARLRLVQSVPNREQVVAVLRATDVYLDSFPYTGANSVIDALEAGLPTVALEGRQMRCRQAAALLRSAGLDDLVATSAEGYVSLAVRLGADAELRRAVSSRVRAVVAGSPIFLDPAAYSAQCAALFRELAARR
jgi:predicted O-linked N-acetylglucosamine transferase (SPINDLY family)